MELNGDGHLDILFSCENAHPPKNGLTWLSCHGPPRGGVWQSYELSGSDGVKYDLLTLVDLDEDGDLDVLTTEEVRNRGVIWYENPFGAPPAVKKDSKAEHSKPSPTDR